jgi:hypothetical protein
MTGIDDGNRLVGRNSATYRGSNLVRVKPGSPVPWATRSAGKATRSSTCGCPASSRNFPLPRGMGGIPSSWARWPRRICSFLMTGGSRPSVRKTDKTDSNSWKIDTGAARPLSPVSSRWTTGRRLGIRRSRTPSLTGYSITRTRLLSEGNRCENVRHWGKTPSSQPNRTNPGVAALRWGGSFRLDWVAGITGIRISY